LVTIARSSVNPAAAGNFDHLNLRTAFNVRQNRRLPITPATAKGLPLLAGEGRVRENASLPIDLSLRQ